MTNNLTLYHYWRSSCSWRVRWVLAIKGISYESTTVNLLKSEQKSGEFLHINPAGQVPVLIVDGKPLTESLAIIEWLEDLYPEPAVIGKDPWQRALAREIAAIVAAGIQPLQNLKVQEFYSDDVAKRLAWNRHFTENGLSVLEMKLAKHSGPYCLGKNLTLADIFLIPQVYNA
jgi:maleylacetoacetate isomerase